MNKNFLLLLAASVFFLSANATNADEEARFYKYLKTCRTYNSVKTNSENFKAGREKDLSERCCLDTYRHGHH